MKPEKYSMLKNAMNFGAILGLALIVLSLITYFLDLTAQNNLVSVLTIAVNIGVIIIGTKYYRDKTLGGFISYGQALGAGVLIGLFASIISGFYTYIFFKFIDPSMIDKILSIAEENMRSSSQAMADEQIEMAMKYTKMMTQPAWMFLFSILGSTFWSFIISLVTSSSFGVGNVLITKWLC